MQIQTDSAITELELQIESAKPYGHTITRTHRFAVVSKSRGYIGSIDTEDLLDVTLRLIFRNAVRTGLKLDFRVFALNQEKQLWKPHTNTVTI